MYINNEEFNGHNNYCILLIIIIIITTRLWSVLLYFCIYYIIPFKWVNDHKNYSFLLWPILILC